MADSSNVPSWLNSISVIVGTLAVAGSIVWTSLEARETLRSLQVEADVTLAKIFLTDILKNATGDGEVRIIESCYDRMIRQLGEDKQKKAIDTCTVRLARARVEQLAGYETALQLANRHPLLCRPFREFMEQMVADFPQTNTEEKAVLARLRECPVV